MTSFSKILRTFRTGIKPGFFILAAFVIFLSQNASSRTNPAVAQVSGVRHWAGPNYTRVTIDLSRKAQYIWRLLEKDPSIGKPRRLYIDIEGAKLGEGLKKEIPVEDVFLKSIRAGQYDKDTVRVVLDIQTIKDYRVFPLSNPFRIVIDIQGDGFKAKPAAEKKEDRPAKGTAAVKTIVIDPGHGGHDPGAIGKGGLKEKDVTLRIANLLKDELEGKLKANIVVTRKKDTFIALDERTAVANSKEADLFISIHANASPKREASGVETYYLSSSWDRDAMMVAARENSSTKEEMEDTLQYILKDLQKTGSQQESIRLATAVEEELSSALKKNYSAVEANGVKGALFYVLVNCDMPSILVEVSYISNPLEEKRLGSEKYLEEIARGITNGILKYLSAEGV